MLRMTSLKFERAGRCTTGVLLMAIALFTGCRAVGPDYCGPPASPAPVEWTLENNERVESTLPALDDWWTVFDDPVLDTILANINEQNLSMKAAAWKIYQARASLCATRGDLFPKIATGASYTLNRSTGSRRGAYSSGVLADSWAWGLSANWELDVFGQLRRMVEAQEAELEATEEDYRNTKIILLADAARTYIDARLCQERMEIIRANIKQQREFLQIIEARYKAGKDDKLPYLQAMGNLNSVEAQYPLVVNTYQECLNRLSVLMGSPPGTVDDLMKKVEPIPPATDAIATSVPADILHRRPDIRALERRLAAQTARIGIAEAEKYPKFFIAGSFGLEASQLKDIFKARSITANLTPSVQWNIMQFGKIRCQIMYQEGVTEQMRYEYQQMVLNAAEEVDNAISNFVRLHQRVKSLEETVLQYRDALDVSERLYAGGRSNYLPVLDSQRYVLQYEETLAMARGSLASSVVQIYRALGGGWQVDPVASSTTRQIDRFANRNVSGVGATSSPGDGVNMNGPVNSRHLPDSIAKPSDRNAVSALNHRKVNGGEGAALDPQEDLDVYPNTGINTPTLPPTPMEMDTEDDGFMPPPDLDPPLRPLSADKKSKQKAPLKTQVKPVSTRSVKIQ